MADTVKCGNCGEQIPATAKFCEHCGADQAEFIDDSPTRVDASPPETAETQISEPPTVEEPSSETRISERPPADPGETQVRQVPPPPPAPPPPVPPPPPTVPPPAPTQAGSARESAERVAPGAGDLADQLATQLKTPGVALAGIAALVGLGVCLAGGLLLALITPNSSLLSLGGSGLLKETLGQAASFSQTNLSASDGSTGRLVPVLFVLFPVLGVALGSATQAGRTAGLAPRDRLLWAAAAGIPFAVAMLVVALAVGHIDVDLLDERIKFPAGSVFLLSLFWGALGGVGGMLFALRREGLTMPSVLPPRPARVAGVVWAALRPLALALLALGAISTLLWVVQMVNEDEYREFPDRSTAVAVGEQIAYAGDHAVGTASLGAIANQRQGIYPAVPIAVDQVSDLLGGSGGEGETSTYDIFDFSDTMSVALFIPMLILFIGIPALLALYAGFAVARRVEEGRPPWAAAWGAAVGPVWAVAMVLLATLVRKEVVANPVGDSVFVAFLLGGAALGALGGFLAAQSQDAQAGV